MFTPSPGTLYENLKYSFESFYNKPLVEQGIHPHGEQEDAVERFINMLDLGTPPHVTTLSVEDDLIEIETSAPLAIILAEFAETVNELSPVDEQILLSRCTFMLSLPERLANVVFSEPHGTSSFNADLTLFLSRMCQALCCFIFAGYNRPCTSTSPSAGNKRYRIKKCNVLVVCHYFIQCLCRRGHMRVFSRYFVTFLRNANQSKNLPVELLPLVFKAIWKSAPKRRNAPRVQQDSTYVSHVPTLYWSEWVMFFLYAASKEANIKAILLRGLPAMLRVSAVDSNMPFGSLDIHHALENELFFTMSFCHSTQRDVLRLIFRDILPAILTSDENRDHKNITEFEKNIFTTILRTWASTDFVERAPVDQNTTLANAVMYILLHLKEYYGVDKDFRLPTALLQPLLAGISLRFESVRFPSMRNDGMIVASAFASFFVGGEAYTAFSNLEQALGMFNNWLESEACHTSLSDPLYDDERLHRTHEANKCLLGRCCVEGEKYPLDPDAQFAFFAFMNSVDCDKKTPDLETTYYGELDPVGHNELVSFGKTHNERDKLDDDIDLLTTLRESYNAIMGIGRGGNAQLYEVQRDIESSFRGFYTALRRLRDKLGRWSEDVAGGNVYHAPEKVSEEINTMIGPLFPALLSVNVHAPEPRKRELEELKHFILVSIIVISPAAALNQLSKMVYSNCFSIFQRVELAKAVGEAAQHLSRVETRLDSNQMSKQLKNDESCKMAKRIYPPIPVPRKTTTIGLFEGKNTRRWGNAVTHRVNKSEKLFVNLLADVAHLFIASLLTKSEDDHFSFFRDSDPYVSAEVLRSISVVVQCVASNRHIAPVLCENIMPFVLTVVSQHPLPTIRRQCWILAGEVMRSWCGAGPLISYNDASVRPYGGLIYSSSLTFSQEWKSAQRALESTFSLKEDPLSADVAIIVLADLQDIVAATLDFENMKSRAVVPKRIVITTTSGEGV